MTDALHVEYGPEIEEAIAAIECAIAASPAVADEFPARWLALELLENGDDLRTRIAALEGGPGVIAAAEDAMETLSQHHGDNAQVAVAGGRYDWVQEVAIEITLAGESDAPTRSDRIDRVVTHPLTGVPIFLFAMWAVFKLTADVAAVFLDWIDAVVNGPIARWVASAIGAVGFGDTWFEDLMVDGVVAGVGGILVFLPVLIALYMALAVLEDSGYMARAALVMDRVMRRLGLPAKSFLPMLVGFGCTVPAIYATRTLERRRDRILTGLLVPFMSCGARLPVYVLMAAAFFPNRRGMVVFGMYLLGVAVALVLGFVANRTVMRATTALPLMLELPSYRRPTLRAVWFHTWKRTSSFVKDAGTIILATSIVLWVLMAIPIGGGSFADTDIEDSAFGRTAQLAAPVFEPAGFGSWEATGALATGFVAKEVVVTSMAQIYGTDGVEADEGNPSFAEDIAEVGSGFVRALSDTALAVPGIVGIDLLDDETETGSVGLIAAVTEGFDAASGGRGALAALAFCVFVLLYTPCVAAVAAARRELGSRWMWTSIIGQTALAWSMAVLTYQVGRLLSLG
jgi:ferrous iron transport protein B